MRATWQTLVKVANGLHLSQAVWYATMVRVKDWEEVHPSEARERVGNIGEPQTSREVWGR